MDLRESASIESLQCQCTVAALVSHNMFTGREVTAPTALPRKLQGKVPYTTIQQDPHERDNKDREESLVNILVRNVSGDPREIFEKVRNDRSSHEQARRASIEVALFSPNGSSQTLTSKKDHQRSYNLRIWCFRGDRNSTKEHKDIDSIIVWYEERDRLRYCKDKVVNEEGRKLLKFCEEMSFKIVNGKYAEDKEGEYLSSMLMGKA
ncbi:hypothetical protein ANN_26854 [Periplaneta americana]|uniref:Uncharacterized protein n=1 Tax=Periplaneta americana TaxID=6978 RepID=A0ABQ8RZJ5_PERAM|nr:hypothetical protein ANN_26854 [Periplaneta americana]